MKTLDIKQWGMSLVSFFNEAKKEHRLFVLLMLIWSGITSFLDSPEMTAGINQSVPLMVVLSLITFLLLLELSWWLFIRFWLRMGLSGVDTISLNYKNLEVWQQIAFAWASFALLLLVGLGCIVAVV